MRRYALFRVRYGIQREIMSEAMEQSDEYKRCSDWYVHADDAAALQAERDALRGRVELLEYYWKASSWFDEVADIWIGISVLLNGRTKRQRKDLLNEHQTIEGKARMEFGKAQALLAGHAPATDHIGDATEMVTATTDTREERLAEALRKCLKELRNFQILAHGRIEFPPTEGMALAETALLEAGE